MTPLPRACRWILLAVVTLGSVSVAVPASADDPPQMYIDLFRNRVMKCLHSTVNATTATIEITKPAVTTGDITTVRVKAFYAGLVRKNELEAELMLRRAGSIKQIRINVLSDSGVRVSTCNLEKNWEDF